MAPPIVPRRTAPFLRFFVVTGIGCWVLGSCGEHPDTAGQGNGGAAGETAFLPKVCDDGVLCDGVCVDLDRNGRNCGACGHVCEFGQTCERGACACPEDQELCESGCVALSQDPENCGSCANACRTDRVCKEGECACPDGTLACDGVCVDLTTDSTHCGACGLTCGPLDACQGARCLHRPGPASDDCGGAARNLKLRAITANQAVEIPLFAIDETTPSRNAPLTSGRPLLVRAFVDTEPAFLPRTLASRLFLNSSSGQSVFYDKRSLVGDSNPLDLTSTFNFFVGEGDVTDEMSLAIEIVECDAELAEGPVLSPRAPESESLSLEFSRAPALAIGIVPIEHEGRLPDTSGSNLALYQEALHAMFPLSSVVLSVLEPMSSEQAGTLDFDVLISTLQARRLSDRPDRDLYYYGMVRPEATLREHCQNGDCTYGIGYQTRSPSFHVALGIEYADQTSRDTFVHEIGHNMGLGHAPCGTEGDPLYPYASAAIGSIGFDLRDRALFDPSTTKDIMSYCDPAWSSDYTYRTVFSALTKSTLQSARVHADSPRLDVNYDFVPIEIRDGAIRVRPSLRSLDLPEEDPEFATALDEAGATILATEVYRILTGDSSLVTWLIPKPEADWAQIALPDGTLVNLSAP